MKCTFLDVKDLKDVLDHRDQEVNQVFQEQLELLALRGHRDPEVCLGNVVSPDHLVSQVLQERQDCLDLTEDVVIEEKLDCQDQAVSLVLVVNLDLLVRLAHVACPVKGEK